MKIRNNNTTDRISFNGQLILPQSMPTQKLKSVILLDEHNNKQLPRILDIIGRYDAKQVPDEVRLLGKVCFVPLSI